MLTRDAAHRLAVDLGLGPYADGLVTGMQPAYRLATTSGGPHRLGGEPDLVGGERWPTNADGDELIFLGQIDVSRLPELAEAPRAVAVWRGRPTFLRIFADFLEPPCGQPVDVVVLEADASAQRHRAAPARRARTWGPDDELVVDRLEDREVDARPCWTLEREDPAVSLAAEVPNPSDLVPAPVVRFIEGVHTGEPPSDYGWHLLPQLFGAPHSVHEDVRFDAALFRDNAVTDVDRADWTLLLQFEASSGEQDLQVFVVVPTADLMAGRYDQAVCLVPF
jgi:hypothetical protein